MSLPRGPWLASLRCVGEQLAGVAFLQRARMRRPCLSCVEAANGPVPYPASLCSWLGLRWRVLQAAPAVLRDAAALEYLSCLDVPRLGGGSGSDDGSSGSSGSTGSSSDGEEEGEQEQEQDQAAAAAAAAAAAEQLQQLHLEAAAAVEGQQEEEGGQVEQWRDFWAFVAGAWQVWQVGSAGCNVAHAYPRSPRHGRVYPQPGIQLSQPHRPPLAPLLRLQATCRCAALGWTATSTWQDSCWMR